MLGHWKYVQGDLHLYVIGPSRQDAPGDSRLDGGGPLRQQEDAISLVAVSVSAMCALCSLACAVHHHTAYGHIQCHVGYLV